MKKRFLALLLAGAMAFSLTACGTPDEPAQDAKTDDPAAGDDAQKEDTPAASGDKVTVGIVVKSLSDQFYVLLKAGAETKAAEMGVDLKFIAPNSESDVQTQVTMIEDLIAQQVSALCVAPSSPDAVLPAFDKAKAAGIPVLAVDTDTTWADKVTFIGTGNEEAAKKGGEYAAEAVGSGKKAVILRGRLGDSNHDQRQAGFEAGLKAGGVEILEVKAADSEAEKGMNIMQDLLQRYEQIDLVCATADSMAQGAQRAIEASGKDVKVMGFDGTIPVVEMTLEGKFMGTLAQNPYDMGVLAVENAVKAANGEAVEPRIDSGSLVVDQAVAQEFLDDLNAKLGQ